MCGITGIWAFNEVGRFQMTNLAKSTQSLAHRGPDDQGTFNDHFVGLGHRRLSIIDTSFAGHQPMSAGGGRYQLVFNGELYNYKEIRQDLETGGISFQSGSDTEVLLKLLIHEGKNALNKLNGFFAFAFYDTEKKYLLLARDRLGIKPLLYFQDEFKFLFASEMQAILAYGLDKEIDQTALNYYLQLNYTPAPLTMMKGVRKLLPGELIEIDNGRVQREVYYEVPVTGKTHVVPDYDQAQKALKNQLDRSVGRRMVADVPLGCFLSGGIDSSVITAVAAEQTDHLATFSIGFKDNPFFDETHYAESVARKFKTEHTTFSLSNDEISSHLLDIVGSIDEPFADSSAIPVYILSKKTREHITVALSGDGADEIFSGYNKHAAWLKMQQSGKFNALMSLARPFASKIPQSRSGKFSNLARQVVRYTDALDMSPADRYWFLATFNTHEKANSFMKTPVELDDLRSLWLKNFEAGDSIGHMLRADTQLVLPNDMLKKVDLMSMANALEVRVPFLDHELVDFVFALPDAYKIDASMRKKILQDTYRDTLPGELYKRPKKGFEMPMLDWLRNQLNKDLDQHVFDQDKIESQEVFSWSAIYQLKQQLYSTNPGDSHATVWAIYVFQKWYDRYF